MQLILALQTITHDDCKFYFRQGLLRWIHGDISVVVFWFVPQNVFEGKMVPYGDDD